MEKVKTSEVTISTSKIVTFVICLIIAITIPAFIHNQFITGPLVNALLLITAIATGPMEAVILGVVPSTVALSSGLLPLPLAPMVPFIIASNALFIAIFYYIHKKNYAHGVIAGAALKFLFLSSSVSFVMSGLLEDKFVKALSVMMSWPQLVTALAGGLIAYGVLKILKKV